MYEKLSFAVQCEVSEHTLAATLNQGGKQVESRCSIVEKKTAAIIDAVRKWSHFLRGRKFTLVTDQKIRVFYAKFKTFKKYQKQPNSNVA